MDKIKVLCPDAMITAALVAKKVHTHPLHKNPNPHAKNVTVVGMNRLTAHFTK